MKEFIKPDRPFLLLTENVEGVVSFSWFRSEEELIDAAQERLEYGEMIISAIEINGQRDIEIQNMRISQNDFIEEVKATYKIAKAQGFDSIVLAIDTDCGLTYYINDTTEGFQCDLWEYNFNDLDAIASQLYDEMHGAMIEIRAE